MPDCCEILHLVYLVGGVTCSAGEGEGEDGTFVTSAAQWLRAVREYDWNCLQEQKVTKLRGRIEPSRSESTFLLTFLGLSDLVLYRNEVFETVALDTLQNVDECGRVTLINIAAECIYVTHTQNNNNDNNNSSKQTPVFA